MQHVTFRRRDLALLFSLAWTPAAARAAEGFRRPRKAEAWARTELYFGTQKPGGAVVSDDEFQQFLDAEVTPRFPDGLTLLSGYGQFLSSSGDLVREHSKVLILFYPAQTEEVNRKLEDIREAYKRIHYQESVLRVDGFASVSF